LPIFATLSLPLSHTAPSLPMFPLEFCGEVQETRVMGLSSSEDRMIVGLSSSEDRMIVAGVVLA